MATIVNSGFSEWKFVGTSQGTTAVTLPLSYTEIECFVRCPHGDGTYNGWSFTIFKDVLAEENYTEFRTGDKYTTCSVKVKKSEPAIQITSVDISGSSRLENATMYVYCK